MNLTFQSLGDGGDSVDHSTIEPLNRIFLQLGPITIYWYAILIMSGVALGLFLAIREGKTNGN